LIEQNPDLDWDKVISDADAMKKDYTLFLGLYLASELLKAPVPDEVKKRFCRYPLLASFAGLVMGRLFREDRGLPGFHEWFGYYSMLDPRLSERNKSKPRLGDRLRYLRAVMTPEWSDRYSLALPDWLAFVHYFSRPIRLYRKHRSALLWRLR
jgi:hypothetical protein